MHEVSLAAGVLKLVEEVSQVEKFRNIKLLKLEAGQLAGVEVGALLFALETISPGTCLDGARFEIDEPPGQAWCMSCSNSVTISKRGDACPKCGKFQLHTTGGTELRVVEMQVDD